MGNEYNKSTFRSRPWQFDGWETNYHWNTGVQDAPQHYFNSFGRDQWTDTLAGFKNPSYKQQIREHRCATTPLGAMRKRSIFVPFSFSVGAHYSVFPWVDRYSTLSGTLGGTSASSPFSVSYDAANSLAAAKFNADARSKQTLLMGGEDLGEIRQIIQAVRNPFAALRLRFSNYKSKLSVARRIRGKKQRLNYVRATWLEANFGWKPLFHDIDDALTLLLTKDGEEKYAHINGSGKLIPSQSFTAESPYSASPCAVMYADETRSTVIVKYRGEIRLKQRSPVHRARVGLGLSLDNFVPTLWELVPYSFLIDYFTNIGDIVNAMSMWGIDLSWAQRTVHRTNSVKRFTSSVQLPSDPGVKVLYAILQPGYSSREYSLIERSLQSTFPLPSFQFKIPGSWKPWANMIALTQSFRGLGLNNFNRR
jgi:hypothetical protein